MTTTNNETTKYIQKRSIILFDSEYDDINSQMTKQLEAFCKKNNFALACSIHTYECDYKLFNFEVILYNLQQTLENKLTPLVIITTDSVYKNKQNILSCFLLGFLARLKLIELYFYSKKDNILNINEYDYSNNLIEIALANFNKQ
jgi:hypothetical protein